MGSGSGTYLDRRGMSFSITYLEISFWEALSVDFDDIYHIKMKIWFLGLLEVVFKLRDLSRSTQLVELYKIPRNQLLGRFIRRFWWNLMLRRSKMLPKRPLKSSISAPGTPGGPQGVPRRSPRVEWRIWGRFLGSILRSFLMIKSIKFRDDFLSRKKWAPGEDFDGFWARSRMADFKNTSKNK